jgi:hypothetical protein
MQSPVLHDYGSTNWLPLTAEVEQSFISGPGNSAAIENDPGTTPEEYLERLSRLPEDARGGSLQRLRVGLRLSGRDDAAWDTNARLQLAYADARPLVDISIDDLPRSGERVEIPDLPEIEPGRELVLRLIAGNGPDAGRLQVGMTPGRAPYGGWRAVSGDEELSGAIVFDTRYTRSVAVGDIVRAGTDRVADAGPLFLALFGLTVGGLFAGAVLLWRMPGRRAAGGR